MLLKIIRMSIFTVMLTCLSFHYSFAGQSIGGQIVRYVGTGWGSEGIYVYTQQNPISDEGCGPGFVINANHPLLGMMEATLLAAFLTQSRVDLYVDGCAGDTHMELKAVSITR